MTITSVELGELLDRLEFPPFDEVVCPSASGMGVYIK